MREKKSVLVCFHVSFCVRDGSTILGEIVVLTCPVPQSLELVSEIKHTEFERLEKVRYDKTLSIQLAFRAGCEIPPIGTKGGLQRPLEHVHFIASNKSKGAERKKRV